MKDEISNRRLHKDVFSKVMVALLSFIAIAIFTSFIGLLQNPPVYAEDFKKAIEPIERQLVQQEETNKKMIEAISRVEKGVRDNSVRYIEDQMIMLEVTSTERQLTPTEMQRLLRYRSDLKRIKD